MQVSPEQARQELERRRNARSQITPEMAARELQRRRNEQVSPEMRGLVPGTTATVDPGAPQPGLQERGARFFDRVVEENVLPGGLGEGAIDFTASALAETIRRPVNTLVTQPAESIATAPSDLLRAGGFATQAGIEAARGDFGAARQNLGAAGENFADGAIGAVEAVTLGKGGLATRGARVAPRTATAAETGAVLDNFQRADVRPDIITATSNEGAARALQPLAENSLAGASLRRSIRSAQQESEDALNRFSDDFFPDAGRDTAGNAAREGVAQFKVNRRSFYEDVEDITSASQSVRLPAEVRDGFAAVTRRFDDTELEAEFGSPRVRSLTARLAADQPISISDLRELRTVVREAGKDSFFQNKDDAALARLEGRVTEALHEAVRAEFGGRALSRMRRADTRYRTATTRLRTALAPFTRQNGTEQQAFQEIYRAAKTVGGDVKKIRALRRSLSQNQFDTISGAMLRDMGYTRNGAFSPSRFAEQWSQMSPAAKGILFNRRDQEVRQNIDALADVLTRQSRSEKFRNFSQSGASLQNLSTYTAFIHFPATTIGSVIGANAFSSLVMRPSFARMIVQLERSAPQAAQGVTNQIDNLTATASAAQSRARALAIIAAAESQDPELSGVAQELRRVVSNDNTTEGTARQAPIE